MDTTKKPGRSWFDTFCEGLGLVALSPRPVREFAVGDVLFSATGDPQTIVRLRHGSRSTHAWYDSGQDEYLNPSESYSLIARKADQP